MRRTGLVDDARFRRHIPGAGHPERPERIEALAKLFSTPPYRQLPLISPRLAGEEEIGRVHSRHHLAAVAASAGRPYTRYDTDTVASADSFQVARLAAGAAIELADAICNHMVDNGFAALRPPGHHAERDRVMGFCLFNNVAIVARHLLARRGLARVLIVDWDVHHGNGTQQAFYEEAAVLYVSLHQYPFYPGTGAATEIGTGAGVGRTVNVPMAAGAGNAAYLAAFRELILPVAEAFRPQFVLVSAGFDAHRDDPLASVRLDEQGFAEMTNAVMGVADECCDGKILLLLEGGYNLDALSHSVGSVLDRLARPAPFKSGQGEVSAGACLAGRALASYWKL